MEKENNKNINVDKNFKAVMEQEEEEEDNDEEFSEEFKCCICWELLYKPVVLACGHMSCFWCVYKAMNFWHESNCPVCRHPYNHFPSICQLLHFLLIKLYPVAYKRRERQVGEEETKMGNFSPHFDSYLLESHPSNGFDILGNALHSTSHQQESHCSTEGKSSSDTNSLQMTLECVNDTCKSATTSNSSEAAAYAITQECSLHSNLLKHKACNKVSVNDLSCAACKRMLFHPVVLNCGHVFCESCLSFPEDGNFKCPVCQSLHPHGLPRVCLILEHFLEEQFPELVAERQESSHKQTNCSTRAQQHVGRASSFPKNVFAAWWSGNGPKVHVGVGCDFCGMCPIIGERYKCKDCVETIGFDLCEACYNNPVNIPGRFNQQHKPDHKLEIVPPQSIGDLLIRINADLSDDDGSDAAENRGSVSRAPILSGDAPQDPEDNRNDVEDASSAYVFSLHASLEPQDDSDDPSSELT